MNNSFGEMCLWYVDSYRRQGKAANSVTTVQNLLLRFRRSWGCAPADSITAQDLQNYVIQSGEEGRAGTTTNQELQRLKAVYVRAIKHGWMGLKNNPFALYDMPTVRTQAKTRILSHKEETRLLTYCKKHAYGQMAKIIAFALCTGFRISDILSLTWECIDLKNMIITIVTQKTGQRINQPITFKCQAILRPLAIHIRGPQELVFADTRKSGPMDRCHVSMLFKRLVRVAGLQPIRFHDLRHTFCSRLVMSGATLIDVAELAGHTNITTTRRYAHLSIERKAEIMAKI